jgi:signal peptidase I
MEGSEQRVQEGMQKERKWWVAGLLSLLLMGLGQMYNGQARKGVWLYLSFRIIFIAAALAMSFVHSRLLFFVVAFVGISFYLSVVIEAAMTARRLGSHYRLKSYNNGYAYIFLLLFVSLALLPAISFVVKTYLVEAFRIPAGSMMPALQIGDHFLVEKISAEVADPRRGDIVVLVIPQGEGQRFVKRVIGLPGDVIELNGKKLIVNEKEISEPYAQYVLKDRRNVGYGPVTVPKNAFYVLGDNRDNSMDSRVFGVVERGSIVGRAKVIYWSWDHENAMIRWNRIGTTIQ